MRLHRILTALLIMVIISPLAPRNVSADCSVPRSVTVSGISMHPLISDGQTVTVLFGFYQCNPILRGDTVLLDVGGRVYVKTVKALPKDRFHLERTDAGYLLLINKKAGLTSLGTPYVLHEAKARMLLLYERDYKGVIPDDAFLVLGNQPDGTIDSTRYGLIGKTNIKGRVALQDFSYTR
ncbi:MAG: signal peptidase I [Thermodesulfovibrionales bacterium]